MTCEDAIKNWINMNEWLEDMDSDTFDDPMPIAKPVWSATKFHIFGIKRGNKVPCGNCVRMLNIDVELKEYHIPNDLRKVEDD